MNYRWLMHCSQAARVWIVLSVMVGMMGGVLLIVQAGLIAYLIAMAARGVGVIVYRGYWPLCGLLLVIVGRSALSWLAAVVSCQAATVVKHTLRQRLLQHLTSLGVDQCAVLDRGRVVGVVLEQVEALHDFFAFYLPQMSVAVMLPLIILICVFPLNWVSGLILLFTAPLIPLFMALVGMGAEVVHQKQFQSLAQLGAYFLNTLQGLTTLKLFGRSRAEAKTVYQVADEYRQRTMGVLKIAFLSSAILELLSSVAIAIIAVYLGLVLLGIIHFGALHGISLYYALFILLLAPEFYGPLRKLATHYHAKAEAVAAAGEIRLLLSPHAVAPTVSTHLRAMPPHKTVSIRCEQLDFQYDDSVPLLRQISFAVASGESVAIAGASGVGKSTLLQLLMGLRQPGAGKIWVNGDDLAEVERASWLQSVAWIGQCTRLLPGTIRSNLLVANVDATDDELIQALILSQAESFVSRLPQGLDTVVTEDNSGLSGGEVQRIAIARAYLKQAPLLLLDEPTASLDEHSEQLVLQGLKTVMRNTTVVMVSHRPATLGLADRVYRLCEDGLLSSCDEDITQYGVTRGCYE